MNEVLCVHVIGRDQQHCAGGRGAGQAARRDDGPAARLRLHEERQDKR